jgi:valyl-tRNA synthetase
MSGELAKQYQPASIEAEVYRRWLDERTFAALPDDTPGRYVIMMPLPNVTGALHMGHAMDNVMQDLLVRWHRMMGDNTLWQPGTDHAGIATQAIVEKRLFELEGKTRLEVGREALVRRIWDWKDQYQKRILQQLQTMGCSCDWDRVRFTMDDVCARAVRWTFFRMFRDGLIFRGNRLVNWDCHLQTAVSDDEIVHETVEGHFWHLRYPVLDPAPGEPDSVVVATTRPETMLGDTAVACHPDPRGALEARVDELRRRSETAPTKERPGLEEELRRLEERRQSHLPALEQLARMARDGRQVQLPLLDRPMPLICDEWAKPELGSGCVKITPAHDPNDYEVWGRHRDEIGIRNILNPDGTLNAEAGPYAGLDRFEARRRVVADLEARGLLDGVEDRQVEIGHSDRSKTPIEPYLSLQWFVRTSDVDGGVVCGRGTDNEFRAAGLAQAAMDAAGGTWRSASGRGIGFHPDPERYRNTYLHWLEEKRDWCISRQLWWGHRIPVWSTTLRGGDLSERLASMQDMLGREDVSASLERADGTARLLVPSESGGGFVEQPLPGESRAAGKELDRPAVDEETHLLVCLRDAPAEAELSEVLSELGLEQDPDVLDTWFSSGLWPHSTLGWPDPESAATGEGETYLGARDGRPDSLSYYYPGSCLVTARDIITLWVARMAMMGLYNLGDVPFTDVFIHANILDGKGERMSKSRGNGIDPVDIIENYGADAMRYVLCEMQTGTQDIRLPVQAISPFTGESVDLAKAKHGRSVFTYICPGSGKEFDVLGTLEEVPQAKLVSDRFEVGRNFCNKLWNAARFALLNLEGEVFEPRSRDDLHQEDRWILSRLSRTVGQVQAHLQAYNPSAALGTAREFFWSDLCDWYLELIKPRLRDPQSAPMARQVLAFAMDQMLRLLHPFLPFLTEALWAKLMEVAPQRGIEQALPASDLLIHAPWPQAEGSHQEDSLEASFRLVQDVVRHIRDIRGRYQIPPKQSLAVSIRADGQTAELLEASAHHVRHLANTEEIRISPEVQRSPDAATAAVGDLEIFVAGVVNTEEERARLTKKQKKVAGLVAGSRKKLGNASFVERAKPEVVEAERVRCAELEAELATLEAGLAALGE